MLVKPKGVIILNSKHAVARRSIRRPRVRIHMATITACTAVTFGGSLFNKGLPAVSTPSRLLWVVHLVELPAFLANQDVLRVSSIIRKKITRE
jgi:hypothetical protein